MKTVINEINQFLIVALIVEYHPTICNLFNDFPSYNNVQKVTNYRI